AVVRDDDAFVEDRFVLVGNVEVDAVEQVALKDVRLVYVRVALRPEGDGLGAPDVGQLDVELVVADEIDLDALAGLQGPGPLVVGSRQLCLRDRTIVVRFDNSVENDDFCTCTGHSNAPLPDRRWGHTRLSPSQGR